MKKNLLPIVLLLICAVVIPLSARGQGETAAAKVTITFVLKNTTTTAPYLELFTQFKAKTGNTVEIQALPSGEEYGTMMTTRFATNDYPDAFEMDPGTKQYIKFRAPETLYDWTNEDIIVRMTDSVKVFQTLDGKIYGIPWGATNNLGVYYNKDVFAKIGAKLPQNWAEFLAICAKAKAAGFIPIYEGFKTQWPIQVFSLGAWTSSVDPAIGEKGVLALEKNTLRLNEIPAFKKVLEKQLALKNLGYFQDNVLAGTYEEQQELFGTGKVAMIFQLAGVLPLLQQKFGAAFVNDKVGFFPVPADDSPGIATLYAAGQILVPRLKPNVKTSVALVKFMTEKSSLDIWYKANPGIPVYKEATSVLFPPQQETLRLVREGKATMNVQNRLSSSFTDYPKILQEMFLSGNVDAALNQLDENYRKTGKARLLPGF